MTRKILFKWVVALSLLASVTLLVLFNALILWVATGPRSLDELTPYVQNAFEPADGSYTINIDQTSLIWDGWKHPIDVRLHDVTIKLAGGKKLVTFPEMSVGFDVFYLLTLRLLPTSITIEHPLMQLVQNEDRSIDLGFHSQAGADEELASVPVAAVLAPLLNPQSSGALRKLRLVNIKNADVSVGSKQKNIFFKASNANILFKRDRHGVIRASSNATIAYGAYQSSINARFSYSKEKPVIDGDITVSQLMVGSLFTLFDEKSMLAGVQFPVSGNVKLAMDGEGNLQQMSAVLDGGEGSFVSDKLQAPLPIKTLHVEGQALDNAASITITKLSANLDGALLGAQGTLLRKDGDLSIQGTATLGQVSTKQLPLFWPPSLSPMSREWVLTNISEGSVSETTVKFNIAPGDLAKPVLPKEAIDAQFTIKGAKIRYLPEHPSLSDVNAVVHVDGQTMDATIASADFLKNTHITNGSFLIEDLNADNPYIKVGFDAQSTAKDAVHFLGLPRLKHAERLHLSEETAEGTAKVHASVGFNFFAPHDENGKPIEQDIDYVLTGELQGMSAPGFMKRFDLKNTTGTIALDKKTIEFTGSSEVNGATVSDAHVRYLFAPEEGLDTFIEAKASAPAESLPRFGYPPLPIKGTLGVDAKMKLGEGKESYDATIDLVNAELAFANIGLGKADKIPAMLELRAEKKDGALTIPSFNLKGQDLDIKGAMTLSPDMTEFTRISLEKAQFGTTDLDHFLYEFTPGNLRLEAKGKSGNVGPWVGADDAPKTEGTFSFENFPAANVDVDIATVFFGKDRALYGVKATLGCDTHCTAANASGTTADKKPFNVRILKNPKGSRQFSLHAQNAGAFLKATNVFDGMSDGDLTITADYLDNGTIKGRIDVNEHTIKNATVLGKLFTLASLTGFFDTLEGNGIAFDRLRAPFTLSGDVVTFEKAKTFGSAVGMTMDGTITFPKRSFDLQGTLVPSYSVNSVLGKVPILGNVLTGGEGQGVFAVSYTMKGMGNEPNISVNPLSILTPGFLRGLFDMLDAPKKVEE